MDGCRNNEKTARLLETDLSRHPDQAFGLAACHREREREGADISHTWFPQVNLESFRTALMTVMVLFNG